jgi:hypothetical protein
MSDQPENLMLIYLRRLDSKIDSLAHDMTDLKHRTTAVEVQLGSMAATEQSHYASLAMRPDRRDARLERITRRLDLTEAAVS